MAVETLNITGWDSGWPSGFVSNIDEAISAADGQTISTTILTDVVVLDLTNVVAIDDNDLVNSVTVTVRGSFTEDDSFATTSQGQLQIELLINSVSQGTETTSNLTSTLTNYALTNAGWDSDWDQSQLNSMQIRIQAVGSNTSLPTWRLDAIDVDIDYTELLSFTEEPPAASLTIDSDEPIIDIPGQRTVPRVELDLTPTVPVLNYTVSPAAKMLTLAGQASYLDPITEQLQISDWDSGWPTGFVSNVDEPVSVADGQTISTSVTPSDTVIFDLDDVSSVITDDTVLRVELVVRARFDEAATTTGAATLSVGLIVNAINRGFETITLQRGVFTDTTITDRAWDEDWTVDDLNGMQVSAVAMPAPVDGAVTVHIDTIDIVVTYSPQTPFLIQSSPETLTLAGQAPTVRRDIFKAPAAETLALTGAAPTLQRADVLNTDAELLLLATQLPKRLVNFIPLPGAGAFTLSGQTPTITVDHIVSPAIDALVLAGQAPTITAPDNRVAAPIRCKLTFFPEAPFTITDANAPIAGPSKGAIAFAGQAPTAVQERNVWAVTLVGALTGTGYAPTAQQSQVRSPAVLAMTLARHTPFEVLGFPVAVSDTAMTLASYTPQTGLLQAELVLAAQTPTTLVDFIMTPAAATLTLIGESVTAQTDSIAVNFDDLRLVTHTPTIEQTSSLLFGDPRFIGLTVDRRIEFIATPTDILVQ